MWQKAKFLATADYNGREIWVEATPPHPVYIDYFITENGDKINYGEKVSGYKTNIFSKWENKYCYIKASVVELLSTPVSFAESVNIISVEDFLAGRIE